MSMAYKSGRALEMAVKEAVKASMRKTRSSASSDAYKSGTRANVTLASGLLA
jgi:hypothetical protein